MPGPDSSLPGAPANEGVGAFLVGTLAWLVAGIVLVFARDWLDERGDSWWLTTSWIGFGLGVIGVVFTHRRARAYRAYREAEAAADRAAADAGNGQQGAVGPSAGTAPPE